MPTPTSRAGITPSELADDTVEALLAERSTRGSAIYLSILGLVLLALALLPFIRVPVSVRSSGIIRPAVEKHDVRAGVSGLAGTVHVRENQQVRRGQVVATLRSDDLEKRLSLVVLQRAEHELLINDLRLLLASDSLPALPPEQLRTAKYRQALLHYLHASAEQRMRLEQSARELERARALHSRELISRAELEQRAFAADQDGIASTLMEQRTRRDWQADLASYRDQLRELLAHETELRQEGELFRVVAPVTGTVEQLAAISPGSVVQAGERVAVISPSAALIAEVYVTPREIGLLQPDAPVRMQIDAFNYNDWGFVTGRVEEIPSDFVLIDHSPRYRIRLALDQHHLSLPNGARGALKKGMTLQARFVLTERTLLQLLRDDVNDWLNPSRSGTHPT